MIRLLFLVLAFTSAAAAADPAIIVEDPWVRVTFGQSTTTAAYMTIVNRSGKGDTLTGVETLDGAQAHIHETATQGDTVKMRMLDRLAVPPNGRAALTPAASHIMISGLKRPLKAGETLPLKLRFAQTGEITVTFAVRVQ